MSKRTALILAAVLLALGAVLLFVLLRGPGKAPAPVGPPVETPTVSDERHSALNFYVAGEAAGSGKTDRVELTLLKATARRNDGKEFLVKEGQVRLMLQRNVLEKTYSEMIPPGTYVSVDLEFAPSGRIIAADGTILNAFLPVTKVTADLDAELPLSRSLVAVIVLPVESGLGVKNNAPIFTLPKTVEADTALLGGIYRNEKSIGNIWTITEPTAAAAIEADFKMKNYGKTSREGSPGFVPATRMP